MTGASATASRKRPPSAVTSRVNPHIITISQRIRTGIASASIPRLPLITAASTLATSTTPSGGSTEISVPVTKAIRGQGLRRTTCWLETRV